MNRTIFVIFSMCAFLMCAALGWGQTPRLEPLNERCPFTLPEGIVLGENARCSFLVVPERHSSANGGANAPVIRLPILVVKSDVKAEDALVLLNGGPGQPVQELLSAFFGSPAGGALIAERDVVFFEQRGTGYAEPALACQAEMTPLYDDSAYQEADLIEQTRLENAAIISCGERLEGEGADLAAYNSAESAADVAALAEVLDYDKLNLLGTSYGSRLALQVMRSNPELLRSVVLASVAPPDHPIGTVPAYAEEVLAQVFADCADDQACAARYPDLDAAFSEVYGALEQRPLELQTDTGTRRLDAQDFVALVYEQLYGSSGESIIPALVYSLAEGSSNLAASLLSEQETPDPLQRLGMKTSVNCTDERPFLADYAGLDEKARAELSPLNVIPEEQFVAVCESWPAAELAPPHFTAVESDVPTLLFTGSYDVATPPSLARAAAKTLRNATTAEFSGLGHNPINRAGECGFTLLLSFLSNPLTELDTSCADAFEATFTLLEN